MATGATQADAEALGGEWTKSIYFPNGPTFYVMSFPEGSNDEATLASLIPRWWIRSWLPEPQARPR